MTEHLSLRHPDWRSSCHHAPVRLGGTEDFPGSGHVSTVYHVCTVCGEACSSYAIQPPTLEDGQ